jgi:dTDP-4-dehydrorhamnose 3,5-epimerase-like enzyme
MSVKTFDSIPDLKLVDCPHFIDDRGFLMEILRSWDMPYVPGDDFGHAQAAVIRQVYLVSNPMPTVRAFHKHDDLVDYFCIVQGSAIFGFADDRAGEVEWLQQVGYEDAISAYWKDRDDVPGLPGVQRIVCSARKPQTIVVPTGVYHGWASLEPNTIMVSMGSTRYNTEDHDEYRIPPNSLDGAFGGSPWKVESK